MLMHQLYIVKEHFYQALVTAIYIDISVCGNIDVLQVIMKLFRKQPVRCAQ